MSIWKLTIQNVPNTCYEQDTVLGPGGSKGTGYSPRCTEKRLRSISKGKIQVWIPMEGNLLTTKEVAARGIQQQKWCRGVEVSTVAFLRGWGLGWAPRQGGLSKSEHLRQPSMARQVWTEAPTQEALGLPRRLDWLTREGIPKGSVAWDLEYSKVILSEDVFT